MTRNLVIALVLSFWNIDAASAQENSAPSVGVQNEVTVIAPYTAEWKLESPNASWSDVSDQLQEAGWAKSYVQDKLSPDAKYNLFKVSPAPGYTS